MSTKKKIAFAIYLLVGLLSIAMGVRYLLCPTIMPYHKQAIGIEWEAIPAPMQVLLQSLVNVVAAGFLVTGIAVIVVVIIPFRRGEKWTLWLIPLLVLVWTGLSAHSSVTVAMRTQASTPWWIAATTIVLMLVAFVLSFGSET